MTNIEKIEALYQVVREWRAEKKKYDRLRDRTGTMEIGKAYDKAVANLNFEARHIHDLEHRVHVAAVNAGIADMRDAAYYEDAKVSPDGWHTYLEHRTKPEAA